jgi:glycosyltransferase involved in cell wall biosynthesis
MGTALLKSLLKQSHLNFSPSDFQSDASLATAVEAPIYRHPSLAIGRRPRLRIAHVSASAAPTSGGPATVVVRMAAAQAALGHEVTIISALAPRQRDMFAAATDNIPHFDQVRLLLAPWTTALESRFGRRLIPIYQSLFPFIDIVHIHGVWEPALPAAARVARELHVPYFVRPCGTLDPWSLSQRRFKKQLALHLVYKKMLDRAAMIHTLNFDEYRLIAPLRIAAPVAIIPNGVFLDEIDETPTDDAIFERFPALRTHPYILFLARLHHKKGLDILAQALTRLAAKHPNVHLLVAGPDDGAREPFMQHIQAHQLQERVHIAGTLVGSAKVEALRHAACFCLPSRQEGFSLSIIEALASRVPVAISHECHFPEVQEIGAGEVFPLNADAAAQALDKILSASDSQRHRMGDAGRAYVEDHLTWQHVAEMTSDAYTNILKCV